LYTSSIDRTTESRIRGKISLAVLRIRIWYPVLLIPGSGIQDGQKIWILDPVSAINILGHISKNLVSIIWVKMLIFVGFYDPGYGIIKLGAEINIPDPHHLSMDYRFVSYSFLHVDGMIRIQSLMRIREHQNFRLRILRIRNQCCRSMTFWCGSGSGSADPCL